MLLWDDLRILLAVHREGTLTGAAARLEVTRTTAGRRLRSLEAALGMRLFDRTPEGLVPTVSGRDLAETAARMEDEVLAAKARILGRDAALQGALRVATADFVFEVYAEVFASFARRYPGVSLTVLTNDDNVSLLRREADVALRVGNQPAAHLLGRRVAHMRFDLAASRALVDRVGADAPLSALPWIGWDSRGMGQWLDEWLAAQAPGAKVALRISTINACIRAVREGIGVHFLPARLIARTPGLVSLQAELSEETRQLWALTLPELATNRRVRAFLDHVYEAFGANRQRGGDPGH